MEDDTNINIKSKKPNECKNWSLGKAKKRKLSIYENKKQWNMNGGEKEESGMKTTLQWSNKKNISG